jgi:hypothetical protein
MAQMITAIGANALIGYTWGYRSLHLAGGVLCVVAKNLYAYTVDLLEMDYQALQAHPVQLQWARDTFACSGRLQASSVVWARTAEGTNAGRPL